MSLLVPKKDGLKSIYIDGKNFRLCVNISDGRNSVVENLNQRWKTLYYYLVYGDGMIYPTDDLSKQLSCEIKKIHDSRITLDWNSITFEPSEPTELIGFNTKNENDNWEAELIDKTQTSFLCDCPSVIVCFNGNMQINGKLLNKYNFANLNKGDEYNLELNDTSEVGLFKLKNDL